MSHGKQIEIEKEILFQEAKERFATTFFCEIIVFGHSPIRLNQYTDQCRNLPTVTGMTSLTSMVKR